MESLACKLHGSKLIKTIKNIPTQLHLPHSTSTHLLFTHTLYTVIRHSYEKDRLHATFKRFVSQRVQERV